MKDFEREEANIDELEQIGEFQNFKEEDYQCNEIINDGLEEFKVKEIQPQSFVENENVTIKKEKKDNDKLRKKINNQLKTSINTSATTTSAVTVVTITVAVSTGIVTSPFDNYGKLDFNNYRVDNKIVYDEELGQNIKYKDIPSPFTVKYQYQPYQLVRLQDISYSPIYLTFHNKANMYYNTIGATPIVSIYKNDEKLVNIGTNESVTLELPDNNDYVLWASPTSDNNIIMPEYQYCLEGIISGETTGMKFPIIYNGEIMSSDYGKTINDITSARTHFEFNIREYNAKDIDTLFINVEKLDTNHRVKVSCNSEYYLDLAYQSTSISTNSISSESASATPLTIDIEPEDYGYVTETYPAYVYWTGSTGSRVIRQYSSIGSGSSTIDYFSQAINGIFTHNTTASTVTIYVSDAAPF